MRRSKQQELPLALWVHGSANPLVREQVLREIPGKRWVIAAHWGERQVVVKIFAKLQHAQRELKGVQALQNTSIPTPELLHHGWATRQPFYMLVFEKIEAAQDVNTAWWSAAVEQRTELLQQLILVTAQLHQAGCYQRDLHLKNFLLQQQKIYMVDAADIVKTSHQQPLNERAGLKNLALLLAQIAPVYDQKCELWYGLYIRERGLVFTKSSLALLKKWLAHWRARHWREYGKKVIRTTSDLQCQRSWRQFSVTDRSYDSQILEELLQDPDALIAAPTSNILKAGNTCTVAQVTVQGHSFVIKRYNLKNFWHGLKRAFQPTRAVAYWRNAMCLASWRLGVAKPVALLEKRFGPIRRQAYFIMEFTPGISLEEYCIDEARNPEDLQKVANSIHRLFAILVNMKISHGDLKANNILLTEKGLILLDLDSMQMHACTWHWRKARQNDQQRFMKNWQDSPRIAKIFKIT